MVKLNFPVFGSRRVPHVLVLRNDRLGVSQALAFVIEGLIQRLHQHMRLAGREENDLLAVLGFRAHDLRPTFRLLVAQDALVQALKLDALHRPQVDALARFGGDLPR